MFGKIRRAIGYGKFSFILAALFAVGIIHYGATKSTVRYDETMKENDLVPNLITNDMVTISWMAAQGYVIPGSATVHIEYRASETSDPYIQLATARFDAYFWTGVLANATNYDFNVWCSYVPPTPVETNGIWKYETTKARNGEYVIPLKARVEADGRAIAPPKSKREDEE